MNNPELNKTDCIKEIKKNVTSSLHPLLNYNINFTKDIDTERCLVMPQIVDNRYISFLKKTELLKSDEVIIDNISRPDESKKTVQEINKADPLINFSLPINKQNFLEIIYGLYNIRKLEEWINNSDTQNMKLINLILNLFWETKAKEIIENIDSFIKINQKLCYNVLNKEISYETSQLIINKLLKKYYGKKIKFIPKVKKYLTKYI